MKSLLIGDKNEIAAKYLVLVLAFDSALLAVYLFGTSQDNRVLLSLIPPFVVLAVIAVAVATVYTIQNNGLLTSVGIAVLLLSAGTVITVFSLAHPEPDRPRLLVGIGSAIFYGVPLGVISFGLGHGIRTYLVS